MPVVETVPDNNGNVIAAIVAIFAVIVLCLGVFFGARYYKGHNTKVNVNVSMPAQPVPTPKTIATP
jgi:type IV secretory pathway VirB2 component (pilin)